LKPHDFTQQTRHGLLLAGTAFGPDDGRPVLLFHGGGQTRHAWGRTGAALGQAGYRAIAYDLRGHGDSDWSSTYQMADFADDVFDLCVAQARRPVIVGASLGGLSSLLANATEAGEISEALVLVDIAPRLNQAGVDRILGFMAAHPEGFTSLADAAAVVAAYQPQRTQKADTRGLQKNLRLRADGRWYWHWDPVMLNLFIRSGQDDQDKDYFYRAAEKLTQPVLLLRGTLSDVIDHDIAREFQERIPHAQIADVGGAGHMVAGDQNDVFLEAVLAFLAKISPPSMTSA
jgi:non-heme chloroperoxidase